MTNKNSILERMKAIALNYQKQIQQQVYMNIHLQIKYKREIELNNILSLFLFMKITYI